MDEPMNYALISPEGVVENIIWLRAANKEEFPNAVLCEEAIVSIGDLYVDGAFVFLNSGGGGGVESPVAPEIQAEGEQPA